MVGVPQTLASEMHTSQEKTEDVSAISCLLVVFVYSGGYSFQSYKLRVSYTPGA